MFQALLKVLAEAPHCSLRELLLSRGVSKKGRGRHVKELHYDIRSPKQGSRHQIEQARKSSEDAQAAGYAQFEKVWAR